MRKETALQLGLCESLPRSMTDRRLWLTESRVSAGGSWAALALRCQTTEFSGERGQIDSPPCKSNSNLHSLTKLTVTEVKSAAPGCLVASQALLLSATTELLAV